MGRDWHLTPAMRGLAHLLHYARGALHAYNVRHASLHWPGVGQSVSLFECCANAAAIYTNAGRRFEGVITEVFVPVEKLRNPHSAAGTSHTLTLHPQQVPAGFKEQGSRCC